MRVLPLYWEWVETSDVAKKRDLKTLPVLRCNLISGVAREMPTPEIRAAALTSRNPVITAMGKTIASGTTSSAATIGADASGRAVTIAAFDDVRASARFSAKAASCVDVASPFTSRTAIATALWKQLRNDCDALQNRDELVTTTLWNDGENPFQKEWDAVRQSLPVATPARSEETTLGVVPVDWSFWINWYQDALEGREPDWDMLEEIALILDEDWEKGPEHINNQVIAGIVGKYRLLRDVQALRKELAAVRQTATAAPMGHNNPPEGIEAEAEVVTQTEIIWDALEEAEEELSKPEPSPSVLKRVGVAILGALKKALKYSVGLLDIALKSAAKEGGAIFGKWGARGVIAWIAVQNPHLVSLGQQLIEYANSLRK
ncbi:hypothetical protein BAR1_05470 [Profundibacter amoris]|uniref:Uncharacterized protein n=2 Tax=Profundibacter amoris TaxID=2171755 RepID=A0A347UF02_9RHOB|nr:hypothetical protein BAR1_05470 [Profundibacter amoris]